MKKFSTAAFILALASALPLHAQAEETGSARCAFRPDAPNQHTVVRGDTLWDISGRFLANPWCWPKVWGMNRDEIRDPHWIYPGQIVYFDRVAGRLHLGDAAGSGGTAYGIPTLKLSPQVRASDLERHAIPTIQAHLIEPFLAQPLIVGETDLNSAAHVVAAREERVMLGAGDTAYAIGDLGGNAHFQIFRPATALRDPETGGILGYEATYLGTAELVRAGRAADEAHALRVTSVKQEIGIGDRLLPQPKPTPMNYVPRPPEGEGNARIASVYGGVSQAGQNQVVTINRGSAHGLEVGHVLDLYRFGGTTIDRTTSKQTGWFSGSDKRVVQLPDHRYGTLFVFRVFDKVSYGLVMEVSDGVRVGDLARTPE